MTLEEIAYCALSQVAASSQFNDSEIFVHRTTGTAVAYSYSRFRWEFHVKVAHAYCALYIRLPATIVLSVCVWFVAFTVQRLYAVCHFRCECVSVRVPHHSLSNNVVIVPRVTQLAFAISFILICLSLRLRVAASNWNCFYVLFSCFSISEV